MTLKISLKAEMTEFVHQIAKSYYAEFLWLVFGDIWRPMYSNKCCTCYRRFLIEPPSLNPYIILCEHNVMWIFTLLINVNVLKNKTEKQNCLKIKFYCIWHTIKSIELFTKICIKYKNHKYCIKNGWPNQCWVWIADQSKSTALLGYCTILSMTEWHAGWCWSVFWVLPDPAQTQTVPKGHCQLCSIHSSTWEILVKNENVLVHGLVEVTQ